ncbi:uncharacterized protein LOC130720891 isoform X2 [Lotus japonicus]|uniref:uncharacterized protein LOC130720891 isoform X2 n=1 Tax=Lotus japonicus TaxID=34305 RepID=UPI002588812E|nr:uncharacterized protein LOC130720891 isoform X2 [Lotus japonicus]
METGLPLLQCPLHHTLRSICSLPNSSSSSKWVYAVFWRIVPRNFPPPRWEFGGSALDLSKGNHRNWILVWEDGFCDFNECEQRRSEYLNNSFGTDVFFKMSHEVYSYGEGLMGKVAAENSHRWVYNDTQNGCKPSYNGSWNASIDHQPRAWDFQLNSGIQIAEDLDLVLSLQRKFIYLQNIPGVLTIQRPYKAIQHPCIAKSNLQMMETNEMAQSTYNDNNQVTHVNGLLHKERPSFFSMIAINLGRNHPQNGTTGPPLSVPSSLPNMSCSFGDLLSKLPSVTPPHYHPQVPKTNWINSSGQKVKIEDCSLQLAGDGDQKGNAGRSI